MTECSPDPHFTQTQNISPEPLLTASSHNDQKVLGFGFCFVMRCFFYPEELLGLQLKLQFL